MLSNTIKPNWWPLYASLLLCLIHKWGATSMSNWAWQPFQTFFTLLTLPIFFSQSYQSFLSNMSWMSLCDELSHVHQALSWNGHILLPIFFLFPYCLELNSSEVSSKANFRSRSHSFECLLIIYTVLRILKILSSFWVIDMLFSTDYHTSFLRCSISTSKLC